ncbi:MAG: hypothetical protein ABSD38_09040 [Syntrophorhabdales bacterium]
MGSKGVASRAVDAFKRCRTFIGRHLLLRLFLIRRVLSALSFNP